MVRRIEQDYLAADLANVEGLLAGLDKDSSTRLSFEFRREALLAEIEALSKSPARPLASIALIYEGDPVIDSWGIDAEFGATAVSKFQGIVNTVFTSQNRGRLKDTGRIADKVASRLQITEVLHGSFGFQLEEIERDQVPMFDTPLKESVDHAANLLESFAEPNDDAYVAALSKTNQRVLTKVKDYFEYLQLKGAGWRMVLDETEKRFDNDSLSRAIERIQLSAVREGTAKYSGYLAGVLPENHEFEYHITGTKTTIKGAIDLGMPTEDVKKLQSQWENKASQATIKYKEVLRRDKVIRTVYTLTRVSGLRGRPPAKAQSAKSK